MEQDSYRTVGRTRECELTERRSRFLGLACHVDNQDDALKFIEERRKKYWNASHTVFAYALREGQSQRFSDDGEPQGTAGLPLLDVLLHEQLTDSIIVVTRFFGGILLGTGGLARAYSRCAKLAVQESGIVTMKLCARAVIKCGYSMYGQIEAMILKGGGVISETRFTDIAQIEFLLPRGQMDGFKTKLVELSAGGINVCEIGQEYAAF